MLLRLSLKERKYYGLIFQSVITLVTVSVIGSTLAITINPIEFVRFQRDRQRVNDLNRLNEIIKFIEANIPQAIHTEKNVIYTSLPDEDPQCASWRERGLMPLGSIFSYHCASPESYRNTNGTGWVPVDFRVLDELKDFHDFAQAAFEQLPIDPSNGKQGIDPESGEETLFFYQYMGGSTLVHSNIAESIKIMEDISQQPLDEEIRALVEAVLAGQEIDYIQGSVGSGFWVGSASGDALNAKDRAREMLLIISNNVKANTLSLERQVSPEQLERLINSISDALSVLEEEVETSPSIILSPPSLTSPILATKECWDGSVIIVDDNCPKQTKVCWDNSIVAMDMACPKEIETKEEQTQVCWDGSLVSVNVNCPEQTKECWDGSIIPTNNTCPIQTKKCPDGSSVSINALCPSEPTKICWDDSKIPVSQSCPEKTKVCWDASVIPTSADCPIENPESTQECPDGSIITEAETCPSSTLPYRQIAYRWFDNYNSTSIGEPLAGIGQAATIFHYNYPVRLRLGVLNEDKQAIGIGDVAFRLQYIQQYLGSCEASEGHPYNDLTQGSGKVYFFNNSLASHSASIVSSADDPLSSPVYQHYAEQNNLTIKSAITSLKSGLWDIAIAAQQSGTYCFRLVGSDGKPLQGYQGTAVLNVQAD